MATDSVKYFPTRPNRFESDEERLEYVRNWIDQDVRLYPNMLEAMLQASAQTSSPDGFNEDLFARFLHSSVESSLENMKSLVAESGLPLKAILAEYATFLFGQYA